MPERARPQLVPERRVDEPAGMRMTFSAIAFRRIDKQAQATQLLGTELELARQELVIAAAVGMKGRVFELVALQRLGGAVHELVVSQGFSGAVELPELIEIRRGTEPSRELRHIAVGHLDRIEHWQQRLRAQIVRAPIAHEAARWPAVFGLARTRHIVVTREARRVVEVTERRYGAQARLVERRATIHHDTRGARRRKGVGRIVTAGARLPARCRQRRIAEQETAEPGRARQRPSQDRRVHHHHAQQPQQAASAHLPAQKSNSVRRSPTAGEFSGR